MINRKTSRDLVFINTLVKKLEWKKYYRKNGTWTHNVLSIEFLESLIGYNSKTTPPRVKILPPVDFLGSNYPNKKFSSRNSKFSNFDTLAFFSTIIRNVVENKNVNKLFSTLNRSSCACIFNFCCPTGRNFKNRTGFWTGLVTQV